MRLYANLLIIILIYWIQYNYYVTNYCYQVLVTPGYYTGSNWNDKDGSTLAHGILETRVNPAITDGTFCWAGNLFSQTCGEETCIVRPPFNALAGTCTTNPMSSGSTCQLQCATGYTPVESVTGGGILSTCLNGDFYAPN